MKRLVAGILLILATLFTARAQEDLGVEISVNGGLAVPASPMTFSHYWNMGYNVGVRVGIPLSQSVTVFGAAEYSKFTLDKEGVKKDYNTDYMRDIWIFKDVTMDASADPTSITTYSANLRVAPLKGSEILTPYFMGGVGAMHVSLSEIDLETTSVIFLDSSDVPVIANQNVVGGTGTSVFFQLGLGMDVNVAQSVTMFIEAKYAAGFEGVWGTGYIPLTAGVKLHL